MLKESKEILKKDTDLILEKIDDLIVRTKADTIKFKDFSKKWFKYFNEKYHEECISYIKVADKMNGINNKRLVIDYTKYEDFEFNILLFLLNNPKFTYELKEIINNLEETAVFKVIVQDLLLMVAFDDKNKKVPKELIKTFKIQYQDSNIDFKNVDDYLGKNINISSKEVTGAVEKNIEKILYSFNNSDFPNDFINFIKNIVNLYKERKIGKYYSVLNEYFSRLLSLFFDYNDVTSKHNKNNFKPIYKLIEKIQYKLKNNMFVDENTLLKLEEYKESCEYFFECGKLVDEIIGISKVYNTELNKSKLEKNETYNQKEYVDEEVELINEEKQMIEAYVKENVFDKINSTIKIDEEELYKNLPASNKKEGLI